MTKEQIKAYEEQLKPCPFCGKKAILEERLDYADFAVRCQTITCHVLPCTWYYDSPEEAVEAWNKRGGEE